MENLELVRISTCGSVDDGKSTLIGRLLFECDAIYEDNLASLKNSSKKSGFEGIDYSLLLDGLEAEREQKITIDVAYRYFSTKKRRYIIADVPGHEQYTKNMVTGISTANIAMVLIDISKGFSFQSKRHLFITSLLGIGHVLIVLNKMDLVEYSEESYLLVKKEIEEYAKLLTIKDLQFMPVSAINGDMLFARAGNLNWYSGPTLFEYLENTYIQSDTNNIDFRLPVQLVMKSANNKRFYAGQILSGRIHKNDKIKLLPSNKITYIEEIYKDFGTTDKAISSDSIAITINGEFDISRGNMIVRENNQPIIAKSFQAIVFWFSDENMKANKSYIIKHTTNYSRAEINKILYKFDVNNLNRIKSENVVLNDITKVEIRTNNELIFDLYEVNKNTGSFIIIDDKEFNTVGAGIITAEVKENESSSTPSFNNSEKTSDSSKKYKNPPLASEFPPLQSDVLNLSKWGTKGDLSFPFQYIGKVIWIYGLSGAGKSTIAAALQKKMLENGIKTEWLDGDDFRDKFNIDLGFSPEDRIKNIQRAVYLIEMLTRNGINVIASFITPLEEQREIIRNSFVNLTEVYLNTPIEVCEQRDVKGYYKKAREKGINNFTGIGSAFEIPKNPDLVFDTSKESLEEVVEGIINQI